MHPINSQIKDKIAKSQKPLVISHIRPDGDAIGSVVGLGLALNKAGKKGVLILEDGIPQKYRFLAGSDLVKNQIKEEHDLVISLDCASEDRLGSEAGIGKIDINIDHHVTNENFGELNLVLPEHGATCSILAEHLESWGLGFDAQIASALLMGIVTDTIGFRIPSVTPELLRLAAYLMEKGASLSDVYRNALVVQSFPTSLIWGFALSRLVREDGLIWTEISLEDRKKASYNGRDDADLTNVLSTIEGSDIAILFNEQNGGKVKVSWRSTGLYDVSKLACQFGGGGHLPASGAELEGTLDEVEALVLSKTKEYMKSVSVKGETNG